MRAALLERLAHPSEADVLGALDTHPGRPGWSEVNDPAELADRLQRAANRWGCGAIVHPITQLHGRRAMEVLRAAGLASEEDDRKAALSGTLSPSPLAQEQWRLLAPFLAYRESTADRHGLIRRARRRTQYFRAEAAGGIDDGALVEVLYRHAAVAADDLTPTGLAESLTTEAARILRKMLVTALEGHGVLAAAQRAWSEAAILAGAVRSATATCAELMKDHRAGEVATAGAAGQAVAEAAAQAAAARTAMARALCREAGAVRLRAGDRIPAIVAGTAGPDAVDVIARRAIELALDASATATGRPATLDAKAFDARVAVAKERLIADVAAAGAAANRAEAVAYCLAVICQKARQPLRLDARGFEDLLFETARTVARHVTLDGEVSDQIAHEAGEFGTSTLEGLFLRPLGKAREDVAARLASDKLLLFKPLDQMTLNSAVREEPTGADFVFQSRLPGWVAMVARNATEGAPWGDSLDAKGSDRLASDGADPATDVDEFERDRRELLERYEERLRTEADALRIGRETPTERAEESERLKRLLAQAERILDAVLMPGDLERAVRVTAAKTLRKVVREVMEERDDFDAMLTYVLVVLKNARKRHLVALLSLRNEALPADVVAHVSARLQGVIAARAPELPGLLAPARAGSREQPKLLPASRVTRLSALGSNAALLTSELGDLGVLLHTLPPSVGDQDDLAWVLDAVLADPALAGANANATSASNVGTVKKQASDELGAVRPSISRVFRRYASPTIPADGLSA